MDTLAPYKVAVALVYVELIHDRIVSGCSYSDIVAFIDYPHALYCLSEWCTVGGEHPVQQHRLKYGVPCSCITHEREESVRSLGIHPVYLIYELDRIR